MPKLITASYKQRKFVNNYLKHGNQKRAAMETFGVPEKQAGKKAHDIINHPMTQAYMKRILDKANLSDDAIARGLKLIMDAGLSEKSLKTATPAHALKAIQEASKLKDLYPAEKKEIHKKEMRINLEGKSVQELTKMLNDLANEAKTFKRLVENNEKGEVLP